MPLSLSMLTDKEDEKILKCLAPTVPGTWIHFVVVRRTRISKQAMQPVKEKAQSPTRQKEHADQQQT